VETEQGARGLKGPRCEPKGESPFHRARQRRAGNGVRLMPSCRIQVQVIPRARLQAVELVDGRSLRVHVNAPPVEGAANEALRTVLAKRLGVSRGRVLVVAGLKTRRKIVVLPLALEEVAARLGGPAVD
jgi:uncharacterized protein YggU (UPF0235/DUF167 family)